MSKFVRDARTASNQHTRQPIYKNTDFKEFTTKAAMK